MSVLTKNPQPQQERDKPNAKSQSARKLDLVEKKLRMVHNSGYPTNKRDNKSKETAANAG